MLLCYVSIVFFFHLQIYKLEINSKFTRSLKSRSTTETFYPGTIGFMVTYCHYLHNANIFTLVPGERLQMHGKSL